jgi:hypothetical protein
MILVVTLPRRNDPCLKLLLVVHCSGEELLEMEQATPNCHFPYKTIAKLN